MPRMENPGRGLPRKDDGGNRSTPLPSQVMGVALHVAHTQCDPSIPALEALTGRSRSTIKRAISELVEAGWMTRITGRGRGRASGYGFLTRGRVVALKGFKSGPRKGSGSEPLYGSQKGSDQTQKGVKSGPAYIKAEPCKNHGARATAPMPSENPMVSRPRMPTPRTR
uniref:helix-turn-helix domain-containing protein n=1 Tax=Salipiger thiooxidans TaxID=282683 RepID=UPI00384C84B1